MTIPEFGIQFGLAITPKQAKAMSVFLVTWDLNKEKSNYAQARAAFLANLNTFTNKGDSGLDSVRFIDADWTADQICDDLGTKLDNNDRIVVTKMERRPPGLALARHLGLDQRSSLSEMW